MSPSVCFEMSLSWRSIFAATFAPTPAHRFTLRVSARRRDTKITRTHTKTHHSSSPRPMRPTFSSRTRLSAARPLAALRVRASRSGNPTPSARANLAVRLRRRFPSIFDLRCILAFGHDCMWNYRIRQTFAVPNHVVFSCVGRRPGRGRSPLKTSMRPNFHTESRMRENCTYGSMRDILRAEGESRSDALAEVRAHPTGASRSTLHPRIRSWRGVSP